MLFRSIHEVAKKEDGSMVGRFLSRVGGEGVESIGENIDEIYHNYETTIQVPNPDLSPVDIDTEVPPAVPIPHQSRGLEPAKSKGKEKTGDKAQTVEEHLKEYSEMVKADMSGDDDGGAKKSPVAAKNDMGGTAANIAKGSSEEKGGATPKSESSSEKYANRPGGTSKSMTSPAPKPKDDKGDASAKSPVGPGK